MGTYCEEEGEVPVVRQVLPCDGVRLATDGENGLHGDVHDGQTLGTQTVRQDLERVGNE
jgi:hypothetical protein